MKTQLITTGGTIDSYYHIDDCTVYPLDNTAIVEYLSKYMMLSEDKITHTAICTKDSREITVQDISKIAEAIKYSDEKQHIVTHGTFTLFDSARQVESLLGEMNSNVVVFTGSMWPLSGFSTNDAAFNLGSAVTACGLLAPGVYVAFHGNIYGTEELKSLH